MTEGRSGLTLGELTLALGLLGLVASTLLLLVLSLLASSAKGAHLSTGVVEADRVLEAVSAQARLAGTVPATLSGSDSFYAHDAANPTTFTYDLAATQSETSPMGTTWWVQVTVRWWSQADRSRRGSGQLFVKRGRMVYLPR